MKKKEILKRAATLAHEYLMRGESSAGTVGRHVEMILFRAEDQENAALSVQILFYELDLLGKRISDFKRELQNGHHTKSKEP